MQILPEPTTTAFLHAFWGVRQRLVRHIGPLLRERHDLDLPEHFLLGYVADSELSPTEIADALSLPPHAISRRLDALEQRGYLTRHIHPEDARKRRLSVTEAGQTARSAAAQTLREQLSEILSAVDRDDLTRCTDVLGRLADMGEPPSPGETQETHP